MENPYQSPQTSSGELAVSPHGGLARQIPIVAILLMVQGGLELLMGALYAIFGGTVALYAQQEAVRSGMALGGVSGMMGGAGVVAGALHAIAGWQNYLFRRRWLGVIGLVTGLGSILTCYCFPTALLLMIYGLVVYLNAGSSWAFALGRRGMSREQILTTLNTRDN
jgi:hypothetical protein